MSSRLGNEPSRLPPRARCRLARRVWSRWSKSADGLFKGRQPFKKKRCKVEGGKTFESGWLHFETLNLDHAAPAKTELGKLSKHTLFPVKSKVHVSVNVRLSCFGMYLVDNMAKYNHRSSDG